MPKTDPPQIDLWIPLEVVQAIVPYAKSRGVSSVALGPIGFLEYYMMASGDPDEMQEMLVGSSKNWTWADKRDGFCKRHYQQMIKNNRPFWEEYKGIWSPTRQHTALVVWAYSPEYEQVLAFIDKLQGAAK